ncbi:glycosyltransferase family 4 protein [Patescibacteria group bacterium]|nr:glycosyltransferase family 4 protein [Patescibacteria group bacterium]MBU1868428.1 glycosyltransferase family 4 protein [Patescibacteria group bacterium]
MKGKRILVLTTLFHPRVGGLEKNTFELFSRLAKQHNFQINVVACNTENTNPFEQLAGLNIYRVPCWKLVKGTYAVPKPKDLSATLKKIGKQDLVTTQTRFFFTSFIGLLYAKLHRIPLLHTEYGGGFVRHPSKIVEYIARIYDETIGRLTLRSADQVIGVSNDVCKFSLKLGAKNCRVIYEGVDFGFWRRTENTSSQEFNVPKNATVITSVGRLIEAKGTGILIEAVKNIHLNYHLIIAGNGPFKPKLEKLIQKYNLRDRVTLLGNISQEKVRGLLSITDIFVNPSFSLCEGMQIVVLEAAALGNAIVTTNVNGMNEIIENGKNGFVVPQKDPLSLKQKVEILMKDTHLRKHFGKKVQEKVKENFRWRPIVQSYFDVINNLCE